MAYRRTPAMQARLDAQRAAILDASRGLLSDHGYSGVSITKVAAASGIATGSVYSHFRNKSDLVVTLFRTLVGREVEAVAEAAACPGSVVDRATAVIETFAGRAMKNPRVAYALLAEPVDPAVDEERLVFRRAFAGAIADVIERGVADGEIPPQNPGVVAAALVGAIGEVLIGPLAAEVHGDGPGEQDAIPTLISMSLRALGVRDVDNA